MPQRFLRHRLGKVFLRIYLGIFVALIAALVMSFLLVKLVNHVRLQAYQEQRLTSFLPLLVDSLDRLAPSEQSQWLADFQQALSLDLLVVPKTALHFSPQETRRLQEGRPVIRTLRQPLMSQTSTLNTEVFFYTHQPNCLLHLRLHSISQQTALATAYLLGDELAGDVERLNRLLVRLPHPIHLSDTPPIGAWHPMSALKEQRPWLRVSDDGKYLISGVQINEQQWLELGPLPLFDFYPLGLILSMISLVLTFLVISVWWFLAGLQERLQPLELASRQIAAGNLDARVSIDAPDFIGQLGQVFNRMAEQVQRLLRTQQEMIHAVSHELRTPVARIRFGLQMIEDLSESSHSHARIMAQIQGIDKDIDELDTLIDEILTYARLGQNKLQLAFETQDIPVLVDEVVQSFRRTPFRIQLDVICHIDPHCSVEADVEARYFQRALQNLISNGLRYAHQRLLISLHIEAETLRVDVEDDGPGIPEQDWQRIFMPFSRLDDSRTRSSGGYGLGLSIVQRVLYWHRGSALVDQSPQLGGARFSLIFPKHQAVDWPPIAYPPQ